MASFPTYQPVGSASMPNPQSMVVDWSGAVDKVINSFVEARKLGMEERYKQHLISASEQRLQNERTKLDMDMTMDRLKMEETRANMAIAKSNSESLISSYKARVAEANSNIALNDIKIADAEREAVGKAKFH